MCSHSFLTREPTETRSPDGVLLGFKLQLLAQSRSFPTTVNSSQLSLLGLPPADVPTATLWCLQSQYYLAAKQIVLSSPTFIHWIASADCNSDNGRAQNASWAIPPSKTLTRVWALAWTGRFADCWWWWWDGLCHLQACEGPWMLLSDRSVVDFGVTSTQNSSR